MAIKQLPVDSDKLKYEVKTIVKGVELWFYYRYNSRSNKWVINIMDGDKNPLIMGIFVNANSTINKWIRKEELEGIELFTMRVEE